MKKYKFKQKQIATCLVATALLIGQSSITAMAAGKANSISKQENKLTKQEKKAERKANRLSKKLRKLAKGGAELVDVIVKYKEMPGAISNANVRARGGKVKKSFNKFAMRSFKIPADQLEAFSEANDIEFISLDSPVKGFSMSSKRTAKLPQTGSSNYLINKNLPLTATKLQFWVPYQRQQSANAQAMS